MDRNRDGQPLAGRVALVAGATRAAGRGIAIELGAAGAVVYCTGRTTRSQRSDYNRPETLEETAELVNRAGSEGIAVPVDHLQSDEVAALIARIDAGHGRFDVLVNNIGGAAYGEFNQPIWEHDLGKGLWMLRIAAETHLVTSHHPAVRRRGDRRDGRRRAPRPVEPEDGDGG
jgi:NAD(P)-dependent dehydrogenase (short-subunit alcohol dehydrogenase family)